jgi:hypothetical protein
LSALDMIPSFINRERNNIIFLYIRRWEVIIENVIK